jgi:hypothetical protein
MTFIEWPPNPGGEDNWFYRFWKEKQMTWTVTKDGDPIEGMTESTLRKEPLKGPPANLHIRAIIDVNSEQHELKALIEALQKHVIE